jgi:COP9 signalosome complex subunit 3
MDELLPKLLAFPPHPPPKTPISDAQYDEGIKSQISAVSKISDKHLLQQTSGGENVLDVSFSEASLVRYNVLIVV